MFHAGFFGAVLLMAVPFLTCASPPAGSFPSILESRAYKQLKRRPPSDLSKLLYLIERFQSSDIEIYYDGYYYKAPVAALVAKYFLMAQYKKETVPAWIMRWCDTSIGGRLIYVKYPDGKFRFSREVLMDEWKDLEAALASS